MSAADLLDAALTEPYTEIAVALKAWATAERDAIEANNTADLNRRLPEIANACRVSRERLLAAVDAVEGR